MPSVAELSKMSKEELYDLAKQRRVQGRSQMDKAELIAALRGSDGGVGDGNGGRGNGARPVPEGDRGASRSEDRPTTSSRSIWKGAITFGLITIPVGLYSAVEDRDVSFHLLTADGARVRYKRVNAETGEEVDWDEIVKGYEYEKGRYVTFTKEELDRLPADSIRAIDVVQFVDESEIDPIYFERSFYVAPEETAVKAYRVLTEALARSGRVGLAKVTIREKERLCTLRAKDGVLVLETMNWPDEIRVPAFEQLDRDVSVSDQEIEMAERLIDHLTAEFDPTRFRDSYRARLLEAIQRKIEGEEVQLAPEEQPAAEGVTDLLEALRASVEASRRSA